MPISPTSTVSSAAYGGHFWKGRFKSQTLLDDQALLICMAYVDLSPIRASIAKTPEASDYTSIQEHLGIAPNHLQTEDDGASDEFLNMAELLPFTGDEHERNQPQHLPFSLADYLELVDWTGRAVRAEKRGAIPQDIRPFSIG